MTASHVSCYHNVALIRTKRSQLSLHAENSETGIKLSVTYTSNVKTSSKPTLFAEHATQCSTDGVMHVFMQKITFTEENMQK